MAIGSGKFNTKHTELDDWKEKLDPKELGLATSFFREAYRKIENVVLMNDALIEAIKISAIKRVINLRGI